MSFSKRGTKDNSYLPLVASSLSSVSKPSKASKANRRTRIRNVFLIFGMVELLFLRVSFSFLDDASMGSPNVVEPPVQPITATVPPPIIYPNRPPDGTFGGYPVYYQNTSTISYTKPYTLQHCLGENYQPNRNWMHRSCHFKFMCFNMTSRSFQVYQRKEDTEMRRWSQSLPLFDLSQSHLVRSNPSEVALGGIHPEWSQKENAKLQWSPTIMREPPTIFYALPASVIFAPYHSFAGWNNPTRVLWDDLLPIFTLLHLFQLDYLQGNHDVLAMQQHLLGGVGCDRSSRVADNDNDDDEDDDDDCAATQARFWPLLNNHSSPPFVSNIQLELGSGKNPRSELVCAKNGVAGIGALTDHGTTKSHGEFKRDYGTTHNHGRGGMLWQFRSFGLRHLGIVENAAPPPPESPYRIVISSGSSPVMDDIGSRLEERVQELGTLLEFRVVNTKLLSLKELVQVVTETTIWITEAGGEGAAVATFLSRGATVIVVYDEVGGQGRNGKAGGAPARLDWDLLNHMSYLQVQWIPKENTNDRAEILDALYRIVQEDLGRRKRMAE